MADMKISEFPAVVALDSDDVVPVLEDGANAQATVAQIIALAPGVAAASDTAAGIVELATDAETVTGTDTARAVTPANAAAAYLKKTVFPVCIGVAMSDETTAITVGPAKTTIRSPFAFTLTSVRASLNVASGSGTPTVDINEAGATILSTKLTIDATELTSTTASVPAVISDSAIADDVELSFDVDTAGTGAAGLKVWLIGTRSL